MQRKWRREWERRKGQATVQQVESGFSPLKTLARKILPPVAAATMLLASMTMPAYANPAGGQVVSGTGSISQNGNTMNITQNTNKMSINWQSFNIGTNETVNFNQPGANSIALNRVVGNNASSIYGHLNANGQVFLVNTNGIFFAPGSSVNVGGIVASTLNINDNDFQNGNYKFSGNSGSVVNQGNITASNGGYVALLGNQAFNQGVIVANQGTVALGAGNAVILDFNGDGLYSLAVSETALNAAVDNKNLIQADGGQVIMTARAANTLAGSVLNNSGVIQAQSMNNVNGKIVLDGGTSGTVTNSGTLDASGKIAGQTGGTVKVLGNTVTLATGANLDVSGYSGGGTVLVGGNSQGQGPEQNATTATVANGATINADAITSGNGGKVVVWSDKATGFDGTISARGGAVSGNGGRVETSGKKLAIGDNALVTTLAAKGTAGNWLLDPAGFTIASAGGDITGTKLSSQLASNNITIKSTQGSGADGNINVNDAISWSADTTLELDATNSVNVNAAVTSTGAGAGLTLNATKGDINLNSSMAMASSATMNAANNANIYAPLSWSGGNLTLKAGNNVNDFKNLTWSAGTLKMIAGNDVNLNYGLTVPATASASTAVILAGGNDINVNCAVYSFMNPQVNWAAGTLTLNAGKDIYINGYTKASGTANLVANYGYVLDVNGNPTSTATTGTNSDGTPYGLYCLQVPAGSYYYGSIDLSGTGSVTINNQGYTVITTAAQLSAVNNNLSGNYVLGSYVVVNMTSATPTLTVAIGSNSVNGFTGNFNGLGHYVSGTLLATGLFDTIGSYGVVSNLGVSGTISQPTSGTITTSAVGTLANNNKGTIINSYGAGAINYTTATSSGAFYTGGLVGDNSGLIALSYSNSGTKYAVNIAGGLVGLNETGGTIVDCAAAGGITNGASTNITYIGGLVGENDGTIKLSYVIPGTSGPLNLKDTSSMTGGLVGLNTGLIDQCYAAGYSTGTNPNLAGFVWKNTGTIDDSYSIMLASKNTSATQNWKAGFVYDNSGTINGAYATEYVTNTTSTPQSGFSAVNTGTITDAYWYANVASGATAPTDTTKAVSLTADQAAKFANYAGFDSSEWSASTSGYPILGNIPIYISNSVYDVYYGQATSDPVYLALSAANAQGGGGFGSVDNPGQDTYDSATNTFTNPFQVTTDNGYVDAGYQAASLILTSSAYKNIYGYVSVSPRTLGIDGTIANRIYDGTTTATLNTSGAANNGLVGVVGNQHLGITYSNAVFSDANAGSQTVTITYSNLSGGANGGIASNYTIANTTTTNGVTTTKATSTITPATLTATFTGTNKTYDGTTSDNVSFVSLNGVLAQDAADVLLSITPTVGTFSDANAGSSKTVSISGLSLTGSASGNYTISNATTTATISPLPLTLAGAIAANGSTTVSGANIAGSNVVVGDTVTFSGSATIPSASTGTQSITNLSGLTVSNPNYTLTGSTGSVYVYSGNPGLQLDHVVSGTATIATSGTTTTVTSTTDKAIIDWLSFSLARGNTLNFVENNATAIVLNRVTTNTPSIIAGTLTANGRVFLINPSGILFSSGSQVNVGGLVASTLGISDSNFLSDNYVFATTKGNGSVTALGEINVVSDGFLALVSNDGVTSTGSVSVPGGEVLLVSADGLNFTLDSSGLTGYAISGLDGAMTLGGAVNVGDGLLETAGNSVTLSNGYQISTGNSGTWSWTLPTITIGSGGNFTSAFVQNNLLLRNLSLNALVGDLTVNDAVAWSANTTLGLSAKNNININNAITINGASAGLTMNFGGDYLIRTPASYSGAVLDAKGNPVAQTDTSGGVYGSITFTNSTNLHGLIINGKTYTLIYSMDQLDALDKLNSVSGANSYPKFASISDYISNITASGNNVYYYYFDNATGMYDLSASKVVNGKLFYYNPATKAYDLTAATPNYYYNSATGAYDIPVSKVQVVNGNGTTYYYNPVTKAYDLTSYYIGTTDTVAYNPVFYYNSATNLYDIAQVKVINGTKYFYDFANRTYDLTAPYAGTTQWVYNTATGYYDIPRTQITNGTTYYYNSASGNYDLTRAPSSINYYYNPTTGIYDIPATKQISGTTNYYNPATGTYQTSYVYYSTPYYYNPTDGLYDLTSLYTVSDNYALAKNLDASGSSYRTALIQSFSGNFTGLGHTISNLSFESQYKSMSWSVPTIYLGLIGTATGSTIRDVGLVNAGLLSTALPGYNLVGGAPLAGKITNSTISNAYATGGSYSGGSGLIAYATNSTITHCFTDMYLYGLGNTGGLVGTIQGGAVTYCDSTGTILGAGGGLIGRATDTYLANDYATGSYALAGTTIKETVDNNVTSFANYDLGGADSGQVGGLVGQYSGSSGVTDSIVNCFAIENIAGWSQLGGLVAYASVVSGSTLNITNCYWQGDMHARGNQTYIYTAVGGLIGYAGNQGNSYTGTFNINRSHTSGSIEVDGPNPPIYSYGMPQVGGLVGYSSSGTEPLNILNSYSTANVYAPNSMDVGGLLGWGSYFNIANSYATGTITGYTAVGGLVGAGSYSSATVNGVKSIYGSTIDQSYFSGTVRATSATGIVGGLVGGWNKFSSITDCIWNNDSIASPTGPGGAKNNYQGNQGVGSAVFANGDYQYYLNGTIDQVQAARAAAQQAKQDNAETAIQQAAITQQSAAEQAPTLGNPAGQSRSNALQSLQNGSNPANLWQMPSGDNLVVVEPSSGTARLTSIWADGIEYQLEDNGPSGNSSGSAPNSGDTKDKDN